MAKLDMVLTAVGPDRPGLVKRISEAIHAAGGNLADSRMALLAGDFALIVLFECDPAVQSKVEQDLAALEGELDLAVRVKAATPARDPRDHEPFELEVTGVDQPGIVHKVSDVLAGLEVNVASLESSLSQAAFHGTPLFTLHAMLQVPTASDHDALFDRLDEVCQALNLTYDLTPVLSPDAE